MIAIIDTAVANISSVANAIERAGFAFCTTTDPAVIRDASHVILPGVGHAQASMKRLRELKLIEPIRALRQPVLGICLGMQILYERTAEGDTEGLALLPGQVEAIQPKGALPLPHMGWNTLRLRDLTSPLLRGVFADDRIYFVHSFRAPMNSCVQAYTSYGEDIPALVAQGNFYGTQFHPERSGIVGLNILRNSCEL